MSMPHEMNVTCKQCGTSAPFVAWESLNVTLNREEKEKLLSGKFAQFTCKKCGWSSVVIYPMLYHDMEKRLMVWLRPDGDEPKPEETSPANLMTGYRFRIVTSQNELLEKVLIFDSNLDDRPIEFLKLLLTAQMERNGKPAAGTMYFGGVNKDEKQADQIIFEIVAKGGSQSFGVPMEVYQKTLPRCQAKQAGLPDGKWLRVNREFAVTLL